MRKTVCTLGFSVALATLPAPAISSPWVNIGRNVYGSVYDVDWDSIRRDGSSVTFTLRVVYGTGTPPGKSDGYLAHRQANCAARTFVDLQTDYMKDGAVENSTGTEEERTAKAGTIAAAVLDKVCAR
jgi:hypothetical protein